MKTIRQTINPECIRDMQLHSSYLLIHIYKSNFGIITSQHLFTSLFFSLHKNILDYKSLKIFRCACFSLIRPHNQHKLEFRSSKYMFLGISYTYDYKCMNWEGRSFISKHVIFNETVFPYHDLHSMSHSSPSKSS